jgi:hypothetical protein
MPKYVGNYRVVPTASACSDAWSLCGDRKREYWKLREHAFKLVYWPDGESEVQADLDWDWIKGYERLRIGELRIDEPINGKENIRVIFFKANQKIDGEPLCRIWLLSVFAKKRQDFGTGQLAAFKGMRTIIVERYYGRSSEA